MNDEYKEYCAQTAKAFAMSMEQVNSQMVSLMQSAKFGIENLKAWEEVVSPTHITIGNKRNGTQDRQQAFGNLF